MHFQKMILLLSWELYVNHCGWMSAQFVCFFSVSEMFALFKWHTWNESVLSKAFQGSQMLPNDQKDTNILLTFNLWFFMKKNVLCITCKRVLFSSLICNGQHCFCSVWNVNNIFWAKVKKKRLGWKGKPHKRL